MKNANNFSILKNEPGGSFFEPSDLPFAKIKNKILGKNYELSLVFIGAKKSQALNKKHRKKDKSANVLTFRLSDTEGEIFICPEIAKRDAPKFDMKTREFIGFLFIHGLLHLKGFKHGKKMEEKEKKLKKSIYPRATLGYY